MKKIYKTPITEVVNVKLYNTILDEPDPGVGNWSKYTLGGDAKENNLLFEDDNFGDLWADGGDTGNSYDIWNE